MWPYMASSTKCLSPLRWCWHRALEAQARVLLVCGVIEAVDAVLRQQPSLEVARIIVDTLHEVLMVSLSPCSLLGCVLAVGGSEVCVR